MKWSLKANMNMSKMWKIILKYEVFFSWKIVLKYEIIFSWQIFLGRPKIGLHFVHLSVCYRPLLLLLLFCYCHCHCHCHCHCCCFVIVFIIVIVIVIVLYSKQKYLGSSKKLAFMLSIYLCATGHSCYFYCFVIAFVIVIVISVVFVYCYCFQSKNIFGAAKNWALCRPFICVLPATLAIVIVIFIIVVFVVVIVLRSSKKLAFMSSIYLCATGHSSHRQPCTIPWLLNYPPPPSPPSPSSPSPSLFHPLFLLLLLLLLLSSFPCLTFSSPSHHIPSFCPHLLSILNANKYIHTLIRIRISHLRKVKKGQGCSSLVEAAVQLACICRI